MRRTPEAPKTRKNLKSKVAVGAMSVVAALGGSSPALASNKARTSNAYLPMLSAAALRQRTEARISHHQPVEVYDGTLTIQERLQDPRTKRWHTYYAGIFNPLVVFRGALRAESHLDPLQKGSYDFGSAVDKMGHAAVNLVSYNPNTMTLVPSSGAPHIVDGILGGGQGSREFNQLTDQNGSPMLLDPAGNPELVAYKYNTYK